MNISRRLPATFVRLVSAMVLAAGLTAMPPTNAHASDTTFTVNTTADSHDPNHGNGICGNGLVCSLRAAIEEASNLVIPFGTRVTIDFSGIPQNSILTLIYEPIAWEGNYITVDGGSNYITISGSDMPGSSSSMFHITGHDNILENLSIRESRNHAIWIGEIGGGNSTANKVQYLNIYKNVGAGVFIQGGFVDNNEISFNRIGASSTSTTCSAEVNNGMDGIATYSSVVYGTVIRYNYIVCNGFGGIYLGGTNHSTTIEGNFIGTDGPHSGLGNVMAGIEAASDIDTSIVNNIISGNGTWGIELEGSTGTNIYSNRIGTTATGTSAVPNAQDGIIVTYLSTYHSTAVHIGSATDATKGNIISGNGKCGVRLSSGSHDNVLDGNYIGLGVDGMTAIPNGQAGIAIEYAPNNIISSYGDTVVPQFISGNTREGIYISNSDGTIINSRTFIGVAADMATASGNTLEGIKLDTGTTHSQIYSKNIMYNGGAGIAVVGNTTIGNFLNPWSAGRNGGLAIDLGNDGRTWIGSHVPPGPNNWVNHPIVSVMGTDGFSGFTYPGATVYFYQAIGDPVENRGGGIFMNSIVADAVTGAFNYTFLAGLSAVTMAACDTSNNCSEMSPKVHNPAFQYSIYLPIIKR